MNKFVLTVLLASTIIITNAQNYCPPIELPFKGGEQIIYDVEYKMGKTWVSAGKVRFIVKDSTYNNKSCLYLEGKGKSLKSYDWFFKVRDKYASFISKENYKPIHFIRRVREGEFYLDFDYDFDYEKKLAKIKEKKKEGEKQETIKIENCSYDIMTSVYFSRAIDLIDTDFSPIDDMRASKDYRTDVAKNLMMKFFYEVSSQKNLRVNQ